MVTEAQTKYPEILEELAALMAATLVDEGLAAPEAARAASLNFAERVRRDLGGQKVYIPRGRDFDTDRARREIGRRWNGTNMRKLCEEFNISESRLRQLYAEAHAPRPVKSV